MKRKSKLSSFPVVKIFPCMITLSALCLGLTSIRFSLSGRLEMAVICLFLSALFDALDGRVARFLGCPSQFGAELDSLSDLVCFGVTPAMIVYTTSLIQHSTIGWAACLYFTVCCALRLARFNVDQINSTTHGTKTEKSKNNLKLFFTGVPAPAGAVLGVFPAIVYLQVQNNIILSPIVSILFLVLSGSLMVSKIHTFSSKMIKIEQKQIIPAMLLTSLVIIFLIVEPWLTLSVLVIMYSVSIPFGEMRYRKVSVSNNELVKKDITDEKTGNI